MCAAPCIGPVLAAILVLAGSSETALEGAALLAVYSLGLAIPFVLVGAAFTRMMGAFRWLRDHYRAIQFAGGAVMVALGLLLFFGKLLRAPDLRQPRPRVVRPRARLLSRR